MEPILLSIAGYVAEKFAAQFVKDELYTRVKEFFFPKPNYRNLLEEEILATIQKYRVIHPPKDEKLPFFLHRDIFEHLTGFILFKSSSTQIIEDLYRKNPQIALPSAAELNDFFNFFIARVNANKKLKKIFVEENHKKEIFDISAALDGITRKLDKLIARQDTSYNLVIDFYVPRAGEAEMNEQLGDNGVLLLTGQSFCGKSQLAKMICRQHIEQGYLFVTGDSVEDCRRELQKAQQPTIYLLEDPFSDTYDSNSRRAWRQLSEFLPILPTQHKLIVTSRAEVIREIRQDAQLTNGAMHQHHWNDLTVTDKDFIVRFWSELALYKKVDDQPAQQISRYLENSFSSDHLQPGQLFYLASKPIDQLTGHTDEQLGLLAKADAREIAVEIVQKGTVYQRLYMALGFMSDTIRPVSFQDLGFVLSASEDLPGFREEGMRLRSMSISDDPEFPEYPSADGMQDYLEALGVLQLRGYIKIVQEHIIFNHPTYRDVARYLFLIDRADLNALLLDLLLKVLACLSIDSILVAVGQIAYLLRSRPELNEQLELLILRAAKATIFPAAESKLAEFLVEKIDRFSEEMQEDVLYLAQHKSDTSNIFWHEGIPFYSEDGINTAAIFGSDAMDDEVYQACFDKLNKEVYISPAELWQFLENYRIRVKVQALDEKGSLLIMTYPEAFIRSHFAALIFANAWPSASLIQAIMDDQHPEVVVEAIKGCFAGYLNYNAEEKVAAKALIAQLLKHPAVVIRSSNFFCSLGLSHATESIEWHDLTQENSAILWQLWGDLFPLFFEQFPDYLEISNSARFAKNLGDCSKFITPEQGIQIGKQFYQWIDHRLRKGKQMDTHELGLVDFLFETNPTGREQRAALFNLAVSHPHTGFAVVSIRQASWYSELFSAQEIEGLLAALAQDRPDRRWLQAVAVTCTRVRPEVQTAVFGQPELLEKTPAAIIAQVDEQLIIDAIHVYTGHPQPLWWYAVHHATDSVWLKVIKHVILTEFEPVFEMCVRELLSNVINMPGDSWQDGQEIWKQLCAQTTQEVRLAELLIAQTAASNFNEHHAKALWETLSTTFEDKGKLAELLTMTAAKAEALQQYDELDIYKILKPHFNEFLDHLPTDKKVLLLDQNLEKDDFDPALIDKEVNSILAGIRNHPFRLKLSFSAIEHLTATKQQRYESLKKLAAIKNGIDDKGDAMEKEMDDHFELAGWVHHLTNTDQ
ncbi:hypothetical protein AB6735_04045 [Mucilaginibacter sp. RCC_168]|uniref:nSTAND3 domain-containing NTPase n=1 Tax=Mucilaginibacter sp. RCC_168 TaxID=3239221 RepID=UPI0035235521